MKPITLTDIMTIKCAIRQYCESHMRSVQFFSQREQEDLVKYHQQAYDDAARMYDVFDAIEDRLIKSENLRTSISVKL